jgi:limonene-1,2-epoxide hydrolase
LARSRGDTRRVEVPVRHVRVHRVQDPNLAVAGDTVLTERVDEITANGITAPVPVMGTFQVRDGRIIAWRDYFDMGLTGKLIAGENVDSLVPA